MLLPELEADETFLASSYGEDIQALVAYWRKIHPTDGLPGRQHFDPIDIPELLPHIWLADVSRDPWRFRLRLIGTAIVAASGRDSTGLWCDEAFVNFDSSSACRHLITCAGDGVPVFCTAPALPKPGRRNLADRLAQRVHLPLATDGRTTDVILSLTRYLPV
ncbi:PAS domain-containing protein [Thalassobaculum sp.]|uniref:PAS domain-containing protein n=1 Tax=Thalassobaculum sp. TaxID=2022740 RepID=UPI0032EF4B62